jgi:hypothetical protein
MAFGIEAQGHSEDTWLPDQGYFTVPRASLREPVFALRALWTPVFRGRADPAERPPFDFPGESGLDTELQGEAALGGSFRIWSPARWQGGGLTLGVQAGVFGRFRLEVSSSDLVASDWVVALPVEAGWGLWSARIRLTHWSAHLGDEMIEKAGAERIDFTSETLDALVAYRVGQVRLYGGGSVVTRSSLENEAQLGPDFSDDALVRLGADFEWLPWSDGDMGLDGGLDWQSADRTDWNGQLSAVFGVTARNDDRSVHLRGVFHDGPSPMGQFFLTDERYWGIELLLRIGPA